MALIPFVYDHSAKTVTWGPMASGDTGQAYQMHSTDNTVHGLSSAWDSSTMTLNGSNDPRVVTAPASASWVEAKDNSNTGIAFTSDELSVMVVAPRYVQPVVSGGTATAITVIIREGIFV